MPSTRLLSWFLRCTAILLLLPAAAVVMPHAWMDAIHVTLGFGTLPDQPMVAYLARSLSALYVCMGAGFWYVSLDVKRYLPLLGFAAAVAFVYWILIVAIDLASGMPTWWTLTGSSALLAWIACLWWLVKRAQRDG